MKNLFEAATADEVKGRIVRVRPESERLWGAMNAAQALAHCAAAMEMATGDVRPPRMLAGRLLAWIVTPRAVGNDDPMRQNMPTAKDLVVSDARELATERERLLRLIERFAAAGPSGCTTHPHTFFGPLTPQQWAVLMYKHLDHHLRQFGA